VNGPHFLHIYSYVGIDHPAKTQSCGGPARRDFETYTS
jgi:hypothetical protein